MKLLDRLYEKSPLWFALGFLFLYILGQTLGDALSAALGLRYLGNVFVNGAILFLILCWISMGGREEKFGLCRSRLPASRVLFYLPLLLIGSCNLWTGLHSGSASGAEAWLYAVHMLMVGAIEELIFRGLLYVAMRDLGNRYAVAVSALTFGMGHVINLFSGRSDSLALTLCQIVYAAAIGFMLVLLFERTGSLRAAILFHSGLDVTSLFADPSLDASNPLSYTVSAVITLLALGYAIYLRDHHEKD